MKTLIISLLALSFFITAFTVDNREDLSWLDGNWSGLGYQPSIGTPWDIKLTCNASKKRFIIEYPSLGCQGFWKVKKIEKDRVTFMEKIAKGEHNCLLQGMLVVTKVDENHISYSFFDEVDGERVLNAFSTLVRD